MIKWSSLYLILFIFCFGSCRNEGNHSRYSEREFVFPIISLPTNWKPSLLYDFNTQTVLNQLYEGLVEIDQNTYQVVPLLAKEFNYSTDFMTFTFTLRNNVVFHQQLKSDTYSDLPLSYKDVIATFELICRQKNAPAYENVLKKIAGAKKYHDGEANSISGITFEKNQLIIELIDSDPLFLQKLSLTSCGILPEQWIKGDKDKDEIPPGTGPFYVESIDKSEIRLRRNSDYFLKDNFGEQLPYLENVTLKIYPNRKQQLKEFLAGNLDIIYGLNAFEKDTIFRSRSSDFNSYPPKLVYVSHPLLSTSLLLFNLESPIFQTANNRKLFNYAINREVIYKEILHRRIESDEIPYGLLPPIGNYFRHPDFHKLNKNNLRYNPDKIRQNLSLLQTSEDTIVLNVSNNRERINIGKMIRKQLKNELGIEVVIRILPPKELFEAISQKKGDLYLVSLSGDFSNPLSLLNHFYGGGKRKEASSIHSINFTNYHSWYFDQFFDKASRQFKPFQQLSNIILAENELLKNPPFIVLYYDYDDEIRYNDISGMEGNLTNSFYLRNVFFK